MSDKLRAAIASWIGRSGYVRPVGTPPDHDRAWERMKSEADGLLADPAFRAALAARPDSPTLDVDWPCVAIAWGNVMAGRRVAIAWGNVMAGRRIQSKDFAARIEPDTTTEADWRAIAREYIALVAERLAAEAPERPAPHQWTTDDKHDYEWCRVCLFVRQANGSTDAKPCKGPAHVALRGPA